MQRHQSMTEVTGRVGKVIGNILVPAKGIITVRIVGDTLQISTKSGLEKSESWIRIQNIDSIQITEAPEYTLLGVGIFLALGGLIKLLLDVFLGFMLLAIGGACIAYAFINKRRLLAIYSIRQTIAIFMNHSLDSYQQFAKNLLEATRQFTAPPQSATASTLRTAPARPPMSGKAIRTQAQDTRVH